MPQRFFTSGDPYFCECHKTARLVAEAMQLPASQWSVCFQSRFGKEEWIKPYTDHVLQQLGREGTRRVDVVCAGFSADCLETLEEIDQENRELFLDALSTILQEQMQGCWGTELNLSLADAREIAGERLGRAEKMGAGE
jgi:protoheme ferro-lyase